MRNLYFMNKFNYFKLKLILKILYFNNKNKQEEINLNLNLQLTKVQI